MLSYRQYDPARNMVEQSKDEVGLFFPPSCWVTHPQQDGLVNFSSRDGPNSSVFSRLSVCPNTFVFIRDVWF